MSGTKKHLYACMDLAKHFIKACGGVEQALEAMYHTVFEAAEESDGLHKIDYIHSGRAIRGAIDTYNKEMEKHIEN